MFTPTFGGGDPPHTRPPAKWVLGRSSHVVMSQTPLGISPNMARAELRRNYTIPRVSRFAAGCASGAPDPLI